MESMYHLPWEFDANAHVTLSKKEQSSGQSSGVDLFYINNKVNPSMPVMIELPPGNFAQQVRPVEDVYRRNKPTNPDVIVEGVTVDKYMTANFAINSSMLPDGAPTVDEIYTKLHAQLNVVIDNMLGTYKDTSDLNMKRFNPVQLNKKNKNTGMVYPPPIATRAYITSPENEEVHSLNTPTLDIMCIEYDTETKTLGSKAYVGCKEIRRSSTAQPVIRLVHAFVSPIGIGICARLSHVVIHVSPKPKHDFLLKMIPGSSTSSISVKKQVMPDTTDTTNDGDDASGDDANVDESDKSKKRKRTDDSPVSPTLTRVPDDPSNLPPGFCGTCN